MLKDVKKPIRKINSWIKGWSIYSREKKLNIKVGGLTHYQGALTKLFNYNFHEKENHDKQTNEIKQTLYQGAFFPMYKGK